MLHLLYSIMARLNSGASSQRGRVSSQVSTTQRSGNISYQKQRTTVDVRRKLKRKVEEVNWLW